jgi:hypothetical protein
LLLSIVYVSAAVEPFSEGQLAELLAKSRNNNAAAGLTGMLLYRDGQFMQVLEGDDAAVRSVYQIVAADDRHDKVRTVLEEEISDRRFPQWTMGFRLLTDETIRDNAGFSNFFSEGSWGTPSRAQGLLEWFRHHDAV